MRCKKSFLFLIPFGVFLTFSVYAKDKPTTADCVADTGALQAAVDAAPASGAIINFSGVCDSVDITGKSNILIDGGDVTNANGVSGDLLVSASNNVQISGFTAASALITNGSSVFVNDVNVDGTVAVRVNGSLTQTGGELNFLGNLDASEGAQVRMSNGTVDGEVTLTRNAAVVLNTDDVDGSTIDVKGGVGVFSGASFLGQSGSPSTPSSALNITGADDNKDIVVQRNASMFLTGSKVVVNVRNLWVRQNAALDVLFVAEENFGVQTIFLLQGGGARGFFNPPADPSAVLFTAVCDDSAWTANNITCAPETLEQKVAGKTFAVRTTGHGSGGTNNNPQPSPPLLLENPQRDFSVADGTLTLNSDGSYNLQLLLTIIPMNVSGFYQEIDDWPLGNSGNWEVDSSTNEIVLTALNENNEVVGVQRLQSTPSGEVLTIVSNDQRLVKGDPLNQETDDNFFNTYYSDAVYIQLPDSE